MTKIRCENREAMKEIDETLYVHVTGHNQKT